MAFHAARTECVIHGRPRASFFQYESQLRLHTYTWHRQQSIPHPPMRPTAVVEGDILIHDVTNMAKAETCEEVQAFALQRADPDLGKGIGVRRMPRRLDGLNPRYLKPRVNASGELGTSVVVADTWHSPSTAPAEHSAKLDVTGLERGTPDSIPIRVDESFRSDRNHKPDTTGRIPPDRFADPRSPTDAPSCCAS